MKPDTTFETRQAWATRRREAAIVCDWSRGWLAYLMAVVGVLWLPLSSAAQPLSFAAPTESPTGSQPQAVAVGDFNQDGKRDLVVANEGSDEVSLLLGNGDGWFGSPANSAVGDAPVSVAVADFNVDGKPDVAVANGGSDSLSVLLGIGGGAFSPATNCPVGDGPYSVATGDFNGDGKPDLAAANFFSNTVSVLLGNGTGSCGSTTDLRVGNGPNTVAIGDLNLDENPDLAVVNFYDKTVSVLLGDGTGDFAAPVAYPVGNGPSFVAIGDLNVDGKPDLVVANSYTSTLSILPGDGSGSFAAATSVSVLGGPQSVEIGDFNGDGRPDLAVAYSLRNLVSILPGDGALGFGPAMNCIGGTGPSYADLLAAADLNHDGKLDLAVVNTGRNTVSVILNTTVPTPPTELVVSQLSATLSGGNIAISDTEQNAGSYPAGAFTVAFYFAASPASATSGTLIGTRSLTELANGASNSASTWFGIPSSTLRGTYLVCAVSDSGWAVNEVNETNNTSCTSQSYTIGPDLTVSSVSVFISGASIYLADTQRNTGNRWADASVAAFYFAATPSTPTTGTLIGRRNVPGIAAGSQYSSSWTRFTIPDATPTGTYYVCAIADSSGAVDELDEGNNTRCTVGTYAIGPDLVVYGLSATKSGGTLSVTDTQQNIGNRRSAAFSVSFYLSLDKVLNAGDQLLGSRSVPGLAGGGTVSSRTTSFTVLSGVAVGNYYVLAISDSGNVVTELNETNNSKTTVGTYPIP